MAVLKSPARLLAADGRTIGEGRAYLHLRLADSQRQSASGTVSLDWWDDVPADEARLALTDGPTLSLRLESDRLSACIQGRVLRYTADWPGALTS